MEYDVVVVGAGAAGLAAASILHREGLRVKLLEASQLLGGRMYSRDGIFPWPIDLGGEFIHGGATYFKQLCDANGVSTIRTFSSFPPSPYFADGRAVSEWLYFGTEGKLLDWVEAEKTDADFAHLLGVVRGMADDASVSSSECLYTYLVRKGVAQRVLSMADAVYGKTWSTDLERLNVKGCIRENSKPFAGDENFILEHSTRQLVEALAKPLDLAKNQELTSVRQERGGRVMLTTKQGATFAARRALVCVPITALKSGEISFDPPLPSPYVSALNSAGIGTSIKGLLRFRERFWPKDILLVFCSDSYCPQLWMDPDRPSYRNDAYSVTCFATGTPATALLAMPTWRVVQLWLSQLDAMFGTKVLVFFSFFSYFFNNLFAGEAKACFGCV
jgi:polyamine oxidase